MREREIERDCKSALDGDVHLSSTLSMTANLTAHELLNLPNLVVLEDLQTF